MKYLREAEWVELFVAAFLIGGSFHLVLAWLGVVTAFLNPGLFHTSSGGVQHAMTSPASALGVLLGLMLVLAVIHLVVAATGALAWMGVRRLIVRPAAR